MVVDGTTGSIAGWPLPTALAHARQSCATTALRGEAPRIVASTAHRLAVQVGAGIGKSAMLRAYALARPRQRMLCLAYNKAIQREDAAEIPANVVCRPSHALAYRIARALFRARAE